MRLRRRVVRATYQLGLTHLAAPAKAAGMTGEQCRKARELLGWSLEHLAKLLGGHPSTSAIRNFERGWIRLVPDSAAAVQAELEDAGIEFDADGVTVRCARP